MKKLLSTTGFLTFALFATAQTVGQEVDKTIAETKKVFEEMRYGVKGGVNISNVTGMMYKPSSIIGFYAGVYGRYNFDKNIAIQPEVLISRQGSKFTLRENSSKVKISSIYLNIPIMVRYHLAGGFHLEAGPQIGFALLKEKLERENNQILKPKTFDFSLAIGLDYNVGRHLNLPKLDLTGRYTIGLSNVYTGVGIPSNKNSAFQVGLAYAF